MCWCPFSPRRQPPWWRSAVEEEAATWSLTVSSMFVLSRKEKKRKVVGDVRDRKILITIKNK